MILHLETSTAVCSVALSKNGVLLKSLDLVSEQFVHGERLTTLTEELLAACQVDVSDLDAVSVGLGPGSYTGLRIGVSAAKGIALGLNKPIFGVSSLSSLIASSRKKYPKANVLAAFDARRNEVFMRIESVDEILVEDQAIELDSFQWDSQEPLIVVGNASEKVLKVLNPSTTSADEELVVSAAGQVEIVWSRMQASQFDRLSELLPNYTKPCFITEKKSNFLQNKMR
jgi:tRNA threonylcarbamoyladenosine biosynthesis protein TsaB